MKEMSARFTHINHATPMLLPPDLRDWVTPDHIVFGIIKDVIVFRRFLPRGAEKVSLEWTLVSTSYNLKRLINLGLNLQKT